MFEPTKQNRDGHIRMRRIALGFGAASLLIFIASNIWYEVKRSKFEDSVLPYYPSDFETGLIGDALLGGLFAAGLLVISFVVERFSKK